MNWLRKYTIKGLFFLNLIVLCYFIFKSSSSVENYATSFQNIFEEQEKKLNQVHASNLRKLKNFNNSQFSAKNALKTNFFTHIFLKDSLIFWNTNKLPISRFADLHFPVNGLIRFQNGWYYTKYTRVGKLKLATTMPLKRTFPIHNDKLVDYFFPPFPNIDADLTLEKTAFPIQNAHKAPIFYLRIEGRKIHGNFAFEILICSVLAFFVCLYFLQKSTFNWLRYVLLSLLLVFIFCLINSDYEFEDTALSLFDPSILSINKYVSHLMLFILWCLFIVQVTTMLTHFFGKNKRSFFGTILGLISLVCFTLILANLLPEVIKNSKINVDFDNILAFSVYSALVLLLFGILFWYYARLLEKFWRYIFDENTCKTYFFHWCFALFILILLIQFFFFEITAFEFWGIVLLLFILSFIAFRSKKQWGFVPWFVAVIACSSYIFITINRINSIKERSEREVFASELIEDQDIATEIEFTTLRSRLESEDYFKRFVGDALFPNSIQLKSILDKRVYTGFWERYDIQTFVFNKNKVYAGESSQKFEDLLTEQGVRSKIDSSLYYLKNGNTSATYLFKIPIRVKEIDLLIYGTLESKKIPKNIGFPRLLISESSASLPWTEHYAGAKYFKENLNYSFGQFDYYPKLSRFLTIKSSSKWKSDGQFNYFILRDADKHTVVLSKALPTFWNYITGISFLTLTYGVLLILCYWLSTFFSKQPNIVFNISSRIRFSVIGLVAISLLVAIITNSVFFINSYQSNTESLVREKLETVRLELHESNGNRSQFSVAMDQEIMDQRLRKWSRIFFTDINIFLKNGDLLSTSEHKLYNLGLLSEQMNNEAFQKMNYEKRNEFIHLENIGKQTFISVYSPIFNNSNKLLGYLNLQYFDQQDRLENQLRSFIITLINVFVLLLLLSVIVSFIVSSWIIKPLQYLQNSFTGIEFGKSNQRLSYTKKDEIGSLVHAYNQKLNELEVAAAKLVQTEKEVAWREMAKQVAHEIKNPLTPMKLSLQHLQRSFDPTSPQAKERLEKVIASVIEQIEGLTNIANVFSNFAKLPKPQMDRIDLSLLCKSVTRLFEPQENKAIRLDLPKEPVFIEADKDMIVRVLNNLLTNAFQAVPNDRKPEILIQLNCDINDVVCLRVYDNGKGIPAGKKLAIFEPYFTTKSTGTGLGLAMVKRILEGHKASIEIESSSELGTCMLIVFG